MTTVIEDKATIDTQFDPIALAEAEAIRTRAESESEARRIEAEGKVEAEKIKAGEEAERQRIANERARMRLEKEQADHSAKVAEANRKREESERLTREARENSKAEQQVKEADAKKLAEAEDSWRYFAIAFAIACAVVALPVQMAAFWNKDAPWMVSAPFMLEGAAWVVLRGAAAAVAARRPHWHFRLIAWALAFVAAGVNLWHGLEAFDPATAIGTAVASIAGPGVWDLHEHGRIRKRDGVPTRRERRAEAKEAKRLAAEKAAKELREAERQAYREKGEREAADELDRVRREEFPEVHRHAWRLAADLGKTAMTDAIWKQAKLDVEGAPPGESADIIRMRNAAEMRVEAARQKRPVNALNKTVNAQRANQMPRVQRGPARKPPVRRSGDTQKYVSAARRQAAITAKGAARKQDGVAT
ncbi:hypothetical protein ACJ6WD_09775 [Streptomyces sp. VTCC 41912]|uniref:hypothetical protein n=1 Tax=Streptomyces sp. VTCC 41912 TaxID=3383243 RepID=UPI003896E0EE